MADLARHAAASQSATMFDFDHWAEWLQAQAFELSRQGIECAFKDGRSVPQLASNPSYSLEVTTDRRVAYIRFWCNGLCDYEVIDAASGLHLANAFMLEANDATVDLLYKRFWSALNS